MAPHGRTQTVGQAEISIRFDIRYQMTDELANGAPVAQLVGQSETTQQTIM